MINKYAIYRLTREALGKLPESSRQQYLGEYFFIKNFFIKKESPTALDNPELVYIENTNSISKHHLNGWIAYKDVELVPSIYILRGIPGAGKSTFVNKFLKLSDPSLLVCSADDYFTQPDGSYVYDRSKTSQAHGECMLKYLKALVENQTSTIVVDNTNTTRSELEWYVKTAHKVCYKPLLSVVRFKADLETSKRNIHNVPVEAVQRMLDRFEDWDGEVIMESNARTVNSMNWNA